MDSFVVSVGSGLVGAAGVALKGAVEVRTHLMSTNSNNVLARQGQGMGDASDGGRLERQKVGGFSGAKSSEPEPSYASKVPKKSVRGDIRSQYKTAISTSFTNGASTLDEILARVPRKSNGSAEYQKIARMRPVGQYYN